MSEDEGIPDELRDLFSHWKALVGLPQSFPRLEPLKDSELDTDVAFYMGWLQDRTTQSVFQSLTNSRIAVLVRIGHGCTTLSRYVHERSIESAVAVRTIPVRLSVDDFEVPDYEYVSVIYDRCREAIITSLVEAPWHRPLRKPVYASLIGATGQDDAALDSQRARIAGLLGIQLHSHKGLEHDKRPRFSAAADWKKLAELAPRLAVEPAELIYDVTHQERIELSLQIDLSSTRYKDAASNTYLDEYHDVVGRFSSGVKAIHEQEALMVRTSGGTFADRSRLSIMLFTSEEGLDTFTAEWDQGFDELDYPAYLAPDVFAILAYHYPQRAQANGIVRTQAMGVIMSDKLVRKAYQKDQSLMGIVAALELAMLREFGNWKDGRFKLGGDDDTDDSKE